mmetsp:Transcript_7311/g.19183  ORF Transcript_7311/g.19183 Transcript_7311/m.19183 type:complete len:317 (+) Transcript_7311:541-1491(+)
MYEGTLIAGGLLLMCSQVRTYGAALPFAVASLVFDIIFVTILFTVVGKRMLLDVCTPQFGPPTTLGAFNSLANIALLYGGHGMFPEEIREMKDPRQFAKALNISYIVIVAMYAIVAPFGYYVWGDFVTGDITLNLPDGFSQKLAAVVNACIYTINIMLGHVLYFGVVERWCGFDPLKVAPLEPRRCCIFSPAVLQAMLRAAIVAVEVVAALAFSAAGIDDYNNLSGALGFAALTYYVPFLLYWKLIAQRDGHHFWLKVGLWLGFGTGVAISLVGTFSSVYSFARAIDEYQVFDTSCRPLIDFNSSANPCPSGIDRL